MIESGIISETVEQFVAVNLKLDLTEATNLALMLQRLQITGVESIFEENERTTLSKLIDVLESALVLHSEDYDDNGHFRGTNT